MVPSHSSILNIPGDVLISKLLVFLNIKDQINLHISCAQLHNDLSSYIHEKVSERFEELWSHFHFNSNSNSFPPKVQPLHQNISNTDISAYSAIALIFNPYDCPPFDVNLDLRDINFLQMGVFDTENNVTFSFFSLDIDENHATNVFRTLQKEIDFTKRKLRMNFDPNNTRMIVLNDTSENNLELMFPIHIENVRMSILFRNIERVIVTIKPI